MPDKREADAIDFQIVQAVLMGERRTRIIPAGLEWRESGSGDNSRYLSGYAAKFNERTVLYEGQGFRITEMIEPGFFDEVLASNPDCHFNMGHDMNTAMARTNINGVGGLQISADAIGLRATARLSGNDPDVTKLASKMDLGIMDQMSFAFGVAEESLTVVTDENGYESYDYTLIRCSEIMDVCVCARGAYATTEATLRSILNETSGVGTQRNAEVTRETTEGAQDEVTVEDGGAANRSVERQRLALQAEASRVRLQYQPKK